MRATPSRRSAAHADSSGAPASISTSGTAVELFATEVMPRYVTPAP